MKLALFSADGRAAGDVNLADYFDIEQPSQKRTLQEVITLYRRNQRSGTSSTKTRGEVRGGGRKPWKQKGTGNARSGSIRSPLWRKGGIIFGPHPRSYRADMPEQKRREALRSAILLKAADGSVRVLEALSAITKTKQASDYLQKVGVSGKILLVLDQEAQKAQRALGNLSGVTCISAENVNAWEILAAKTVLMTSPSLKTLSSRLTEKTNV
jgi:large subunit ribosomal protein L4